jgi:hypothetical protein
MFSPASPALVVVEDGLRHLAERGHLADHVEADTGVELDDRALVRPQGSRRGQESFRHRQIADVP